MHSNWFVCCGKPWDTQQVLTTSYHMTTSRPVFPLFTMTGCNDHSCSLLLKCHWKRINMLDPHNKLKLISCISATIHLLTGYCSGEMCCGVSVVHRKSCLHPAIIWISAVCRWKTHLRHVKFPESLWPPVLLFLRLWSCCIKTNTANICIHVKICLWHWWCWWPCHGPSPEPVHCTGWENKHETSGWEKT